MTDELKQDTSKQDKWDEAVAYFQNHPQEIYNAWNCPSQHNYGYLFDYLEPTNELSQKERAKCGCPTMLAARTCYVAPTPEVQTFIDSIADRLPKNQNMIDWMDHDNQVALMTRVVPSLPAFAEVQRFWENQKREMEQS